MAEYEFSHPRIPQIGNIVLKGSDDLPAPTDRDLWNVVQQIVRPIGLSQLTDKEKIAAYKNGYFDEPKPVEGQPEQPGIVDTLMDLGGKAVLRGLQMQKALTGGNLSPYLGIGISGPYDKLLRLPDKAVPYEKTENVDQFREAGKYLFGFLDNTEEKLDFDPVAEALKRTGMPFYSKNKNARGRVITAAMDYAQDSMVAGVGEGYARAASGGEFLYKGGKFLKNKLFFDETDDSDILDYVNSAIEFDALNHRYENSAELAAFALENPQESVKAMGAGIIGGLTPFVEAKDLNKILIDEEDINLDSDLQQDIRSGLVQPDVGVSFLSEVVGDPMNLAAGATAKGITAPQRVALSGRITKTLDEVNLLNKAKASTLKYLERLPEQSTMHQRVESRLLSLNAELLEKQKILDKYARNSLFLRMAAQSSPDELLKVASKNLDTASDAGKLSMNMVYNAMKPDGKIGRVRKGIAMGAKFTPEIAGATVGALMYGPEGAAIGALAPSILKGAKILSTMPENVAISYIMRSATEAGEEITEQMARKQYRQFTNKILYPAGILGLSGGAILSGQEGGGGISDSLLKIGGGAFALKFLPKLAQFSDATIRDSRVIGPELIYARGENSPFFNRLALLPSADEGLIGANADRFQALTRTSTGETLLERTIDKVRPIARGIGMSVRDEFPRGAPFRPGLSNTNKMLSNPTRKVVQFLDRTPTLGRGLETLGRFGSVVTAASTLPAAFGYVGSGGQAEGALAGVLVSAPFTSIGTGVGMFQTFKNKGDLFQQKMGDVHYYREHLNKSEQADFDALPMHIRMALSGYSLSHPDILFQPGTEGQGNFSFNPDLQTSVIEYNKTTGAGLIEGVLAHEVGHHIEIHGLTPMVNKIFFGDPVTQEGGVYGKYNDEGKIEPKQEFIDLRDMYLNKLTNDDSINPADADRYQGTEGNQLLASELFAEQVKDYLLTGKKNKGNTIAEKIIRASSEAMLGTPFIRDFLLRINFPMRSDGKFIEGGVFKGKQERIPELIKLIDKYYQDTRALRQREIQGDEVIIPGTNRVDKELSIDPRKAKRPIDQEDFQNSFSIKEQEDPAVRARLDTGGIFKWRPTSEGGSELELGPGGAPRRYTSKELEKQNRKQGDHAIKVFERHGVDVITHTDGKKSTSDITNLTPEMIDELAQGPWHPRQIQSLREMSRSLREGDGERAGFLIGYFAASKGRKPKAVPFSLRQEMPYGFKLTKDGNMLALLHDVPQLEKNLKFLKEGRRLPGRYRDEYNQLFDNDNEVWEAFRQYRVNTANGLDGQLGLDADPTRAIRKKNFVNALHGAIDTEHINLNPILSEISKLRGIDLFNPSKRQPFGPATKTFRLDSIFDVTRSGNRNSNVSIDRVKKLLMPKLEADVQITDKLFMPAEAQVQPRAVETGFSTQNVNAPKFVDKVLGGLKVDVERTKYKKPEISLADHYGKDILMTMADRTPTAHTIYGINDVEFKTPLRLGGGRDYMFDDKGSPGAVWANEKGAMSAMLNRKKDLGDKDMLVIPFEMAPTSVDFPTMAPALHIRYAQVAMKSKDKKYVSRLIRNGGEGHLTKSQDSVKVPGFDIDMNNVDKYLGKLSGPQRKTINNVFDMVNRPSPKQKKDGVKQIDGALSNFEMRAAISDPDMFNQSSLMQTNNVGLITGGKADSFHDTYNAAMQGEGLGVLKVPARFQPTMQDFLPDIFKKSTRDYVDATDAYTARMGVRTARIDDALLKRLGY